MRTGPDGKFSLRMPEPHPPQLTLRLNNGAGVFFADNPSDPTKIALEAGTKIERQRCVRRHERRNDDHVCHHQERHHLIGGDRF